MSNNDIENAYKEMLKDSGKTSKEESGSVSAARSLADELIDTVGEPAEIRKKLTCPSCSGTDFTVRSSMGSSRVNVCVTCHTKVYSQKKKSMPTVVKTHSQGKGRGPYYSASGPKEKPSKYSPKFKLKSKQRKKDD